MRNRSNIVKKDSKKQMSLNNQTSIENGMHKLWIEI
jgi:hypothetical protein